MSWAAARAFGRAFGAASRGEFTAAEPPSLNSDRVCEFVHRYGAGVSRTTCPVRSRQEETRPECPPQVGMKDDLIEVVDAERGIVGIAIEVAAGARCEFARRAQRQHYPVRIGV